MLLPPDRARKSRAQFPLVAQKLCGNEALGYHLARGQRTVVRIFLRGRVEYWTRQSLIFLHPVRQNKSAKVALPAEYRVQIEVSVTPVR